MKPTCIIDGCENPVKARGWCNTHYMRWFHHGDPSATVQPRRHYNGDERCAVTDCERTRKKRDYCDMHYQRWRKHGDPLKVPTPPITACKIEGCDGDGPFSRGWCRAHYWRWKRGGDMSAPVQTRVLYGTPAKTFAARTEWRGGCLIWTGTKNDAGYGQLGVDGRMVYAHRYAWEQDHGPIPSGMAIDHVCHNPPCVNVSHLRLATSAQNAAHLSGAQRDNKASGVRNVYPNKKGWMVQITRAQKKHYLGTYSSIEEAAAVAERERVRLFGEFAGRG